MAKPINHAEERWRCHYRSGLVEITAVRRFAPVTHSVRWLPARTTRVVELTGARTREEVTVVASTRTERRLMTAIRCSRAPEEIDEEGFRPQATSR